MRVSLPGRLRPGVFSKDLILHLVGLLGEAGTNYHAVEFAGEALSHMSMDARSLVPVVAAPHRVDNVIPVTQAAGTPIHQAAVSSCTNGRLEDQRIVASVLRGKQVARGVRFYVAPGSREIYRQAMREGILETLFEAWVMILTQAARPAPPVFAERFWATARSPFRHPTGTSEVAWETRTPSSTWPRRPRLPPRP